jgi:hypothetical protein
VGKESHGETELLKNGPIRRQGAQDSAGSFAKGRAKTQVPAFFPLDVQTTEEEENFGYGTEWRVWSLNLCWVNNY